MAAPSSPDPSDFVGVVVAAGRSSRLGGPLPKQFAPLGGRPVLELSVRALADCPAVRGVVVVLPPDDLDGAWAERARSWPGVLDVVGGGATRSDSVLAGVRAAGNAPFVLVHDAARPQVPAALVTAVVDATRRHGAAIPGLAVADTVKQIDAGGSSVATLDRERLRLAQTPQGSRTDWLLAALERPSDTGEQPTDEAAALERAGHPVTVIPGDPTNRKITTAEDLEAMRRGGGEAGDLRVGTGFDIHRFGPGRDLVLGGLHFEGEPGLVGHSDADVILHAAMDALLGAAGMGDIGVLFPPDDPAFAGAVSTDLAADVAARLGSSGWAVINLDITVLAERPRIKARSGEMRERIGACLGLPPERVGLKATTLEQLGALGRGEGIACQAVALIRRR